MIIAIKRDMRRRHPYPHPANLPKSWLLSDRRNDSQLDRVLRYLPRGSGFIYRHYHLDARARKTRYDGLLRICRRRNILIILADTPKLAQIWDADGAYGAPDRLGPLTGWLSAARQQSLILATVHNAQQVRAANAIGADAVLISPVFATRSHPDGRLLGPMRFAALARLSHAPAIALGGVNRRNIHRLRNIATGWAAIDGLSASEPVRPITR